MDYRTVEIGMDMWGSELLEDMRLIRSQSSSIVGMKNSEDNCFVRMVAD